MTTPYQVHLDHATRTLRITCNGLWTHAIVNDFRSEMHHALTRYRVLAGSSEKLLTLIDLRESGIQRQDIADRLRSHSQRYGDASERVAVLLSHSAIQRAQTNATHQPATIACSSMRPRRWRGWTKPGFAFRWRARAARLRFQGADP